MYGPRSCGRERSGRVIAFRIARDEVTTEALRNDRGFPRQLVDPRAHVSVTRELHGSICKPLPDRSCGNGHGCSIRGWRAAARPTRNPSAAKARIYYRSQGRRERSLQGQDPFRDREHGDRARRIIRPNTGHHHLLIDTPLPPLDQPIPSDFNHIHFGAGQTEAEITLPAGEHTLQLLLGDHAHIPHNPPVVSDVIRIRVDAATIKKTQTQAGWRQRVPDRACGNGVSMRR